MRDLLMERRPKDWDITTTANPGQIQQLFPNTFYENDYGTVGVVQEGTEDETLKVIEVTPYRIEGEYSDARHPDTVSFTKVLEEDLKRRDFTINSLAYDESREELVDLYGGVKDIKDKMVRAVGVPEERLKEDALRMLRAVRFSCELNFGIDHQTELAIKENSGLIKEISQERIRDELTKIINVMDIMLGDRRIDLC